MLHDSGKPVYGEAGECLGQVLAVDEGAGLASLKLPSGIAVAVDAELPINEPNWVAAPYSFQEAFGGPPAARFEGKA